MTVLLALIELILLSFFLAAAIPAEADTLSQNVGIASSPNLVGSGARAIGMGGAFIAVADDATAASWNPAGLIQLEKPEFSIVGTFNRRDEDFSSCLRPEIANKAKIEDSNLNYLSASWPTRVLRRNVVISMSYQRLFEFKNEFRHRRDYRPQGLNRTEEVTLEQDGYLGALGIAAAVEVIPSLSLGVTLNLWSDDLFWQNGWKESYSNNGEGMVGSTPVTTQTDVTDTYDEFSGVNAQLGLLWKMNGNVTLGSSVRTPFAGKVRHRFHYSSTTTIEMPPDSIVTRNTQDLEEHAILRIPISYGIGVLIRLSDSFSMALDAFRTKWSDYTFRDENGNEFSPIDGRAKGDSGINDTTEIRMGCEYLFIRQNDIIPVRAGLFYDPEPSEGSVRDYFGCSLGTGLARKRFATDIAYQYRWGRNIDAGNLIGTASADVDQHLVMASMILYF